MSQMLAEMREQPRLLKERAGPLFEQAREAAPKERPSLILFVARGSSDNACLYARYLFEARLGVPVSLAAPSVITRYGSDLRFPSPSLVIGVSQSAAAPDVAEFLGHARERGCHTLSVTNAEKGPVADAAEHRIFLGAGAEKAVAATKTFTLSQLALYQLARAMGAPLPEPDLAEASERALSDSDGDAFAEKIVKADLSFTLGRGFHFGVAYEAALKLIECALVPCKPYSLADFAHGPMALAGPASCALLFGLDRTDSTAKSVKRRLRSTGASLLQAPTETSLPEELRPIPAVIFAQRVAHAAAMGRGLDPDRPRHLHKVTRTW
ncbi:MAG: SIS domain-containing protein [Armatimonadetes bacterium]|nr:SIS domain-containing protein [Armatimonadota bacterium]